jgi:hypothetical protein
MSKYALKSVSSSLYFVEGKGFASSVAADATLFESNEEASATASTAARFGLEAAVETVEPNIKQNTDGTSFAIYYVRPGDLNADGSVKANAQFNPSKRRFADRADAERHAARFVKIWGHVGFYVREVTQPANAWINPVTGFTNPVIGSRVLKGVKR